MRNWKFFSIAVVACGLIIGCDGDNPASYISSNDSESNSLQKHDRRVATFELTFENLAPATGAGSSQPLSPPVIATHRHGVHLFQVGEFATDALAMVAEDAVNTLIVDRLNSSREVFDVAEGTAPIGPGGSAEFTIRATRPFIEISLVSMLVNTNDGFAGLDGIRLPREGSAVYDLRAYDAGSEENTELQSDIPGPCCGNAGVRVPTHERIRPHAGINGHGDLDPDIYGWDEPVARLTITRVE